MVNGGYWPAILRGGPVPRVGVLLASHPNDAQLTRTLRSGLTVIRLVVIADAQHNK